jgi:hypothetical protein
MDQNLQTPKRPRPHGDRQTPVKRELVPIFPDLWDAEMVLHPVAASLVWAFTQRWSQDCQGDQSSAIFNPCHWMGDSVSFISYIDPQNINPHKVTFISDVLFYQPVIVASNLDSRVSIGVQSIRHLDDLINTLAEGNIYLAYEYTSEFPVSGVLNSIEILKLDYA